MKMGHLGHMGHQYTHTYLEMSVCPKGRVHTHSIRDLCEKSVPSGPLPLKHRCISTYRLGHSHINRCQWAEGVCHAAD